LGWWVSDQFNAQKARREMEALEGVIEIVGRKGKKNDSCVWEMVEKKRQGPHTHEW